MPWPSASRFIEAVGFHHARVVRNSTITVTGEMRALDHWTLGFDHLALVSSLEVVPAQYSFAGCVVVHTGNSNRKRVTLLGNLELVPLRVVPRPSDVNGLLRLRLIDSGLSRSSLTAPLFLRFASIRGG